MALHWRLKAEKAGMMMTRWVMTRKMLSNVHRAACKSRHARTLAAPVASFSGYHSTDKLESLFDSLQSAYGGVKKVHDQQIHREFLRAMPGSRAMMANLGKWTDSPDSRFAVIKVGGAVIEEQLEDLVGSLSFLYRLGLFPIVLHGAGPQLNSAMEENNIQPEYVGGKRVTNPEVLRVAMPVFAEQNAKLAAALEAAGVRARPIFNQVFQADLLDEHALGLVGTVTGVNTAQIDSAIEAGCIPIVCSLGSSSTGQTLNINADTAATELAIACMPQKMVFLGGNGGLKDGEGNEISVISHKDDYTRLLQEPWVKHGTRLKLLEIEKLLKHLPRHGTVTVTRPQDLLRELFTESGAGTIVHKGIDIRVFEGKSQILSEFSLERLTSAIEEAFGRRLVPGYLERIIDSDSFDAIYVAGELDSVVVLLKDEDELRYMCKFATSPQMQGTGVGELLLRKVISENPNLYWRSHRHNNINSWYMTQAEGFCAMKEDPYVAFWCALDRKEAQMVVERAAARPPTFVKPPFKSSLHDDSRRKKARKGGFYIPPPRIMRTASPSLASLPLSAPSTRFSTFVPAAAATATTAPKLQALRRRRVALVGARGYTGQELMGLLAGHPNLDLVAVSSRELEGQLVNHSRGPAHTSNERSLPGISSSLRYCTLSPEECGRMTHEGLVDAWVMALPNKACEPYVRAILDASAPPSSPDGVCFAKRPVVIDLSADHRFDVQWDYGLPETNRAALQDCASRLIANPGCYATGAQLAIRPFKDWLDEAAPAVVFGVSGYSGAGTTPSPKNDPALLQNNLMPYSLNNHIHEREISHQLGRRVCFHPHVASFFRGISLTISMQLSKPTTAERAMDHLVACYASESLVQVLHEPAEVRYNACRHHVAIGGIHVNNTGQHLVVTATLDNLLKGAATQALQNLNLAFGMPELLGLEGQVLPKENALTSLACLAAANPVNKVGFQPDPSRGQKKQPDSPQERKPSKQTWRRCCSGDSLSCCAPEKLLPVANSAVSQYEDFTLQTYRRGDTVFTQGRGAYLYDDRGKRFLDLGAGIAVNALGHNDEEWVSVVSKQAAKLAHTSNLYHNIPAAELAENLVRSAPFASRAFFCNSGTEANEAAIKFARKVGRSSSPTKVNIVSFKNGFHGRTLGALALTENPSYRKPFDPPLPVRSLEQEENFPALNDIEAARRAIDRDTCAVFVEPVQGEGGVRVCSQDYLDEVRRLCNEHGALLVYDEVQCGLGRTGSLFAHSAYPNAPPDMVTLAKPLAGGLPIGAVLLAAPVAKAVDYGDHGTTFGGGPLVAAAANLVLRRISDQSFLDRVARVGEIFAEPFKSRIALHTSSGLLKDVRGVGLMIGLQVAEGMADKVVEKAREKGLVVLTAAGNTVRVVPPLILSEWQARHASTTLMLVLDELEHV